MIRRFVTSALALCIALAFCQAGFAAAGVPQLLNYQGKLTDSFGWPVGGSKYMTFEFYDAPFGGNLLEGFSETQQVVVTKGIFNVLIGSAADPGVPASVFDHPSVYLSVKVEGEQLSSRQRIASVAYALRAADAGSLNGVPASDIQAALEDLQARVSAFEAIWWKLAIESPQGNGSTRPPTGIYAYNVSISPAPVAATAASGWRFDHWEGTAANGLPTTNPISIASATSGQTRTLKAVFVEGGELAPMCAVPAGQFQTSTGVTVYLDAYLIDQYEVTNQLYATFLNAGGNDDHWSTWVSQISRTGWEAPYTYQVTSGFERRPVPSVTYIDATDFCAWRSAAEGLPAGSYRLPTEAEWEKAAGWGDPARQGLWTYAFQSDSIDCNKANYDTCVGTTTDVGTYAAWKSWYGCYDMTGNVWEWCYDWYGTSTYPSSTSNPTGPTTGMHRVLRGGSRGYDAAGCRVGYRYRGCPVPSDVIGIVGFRAARTAQ